MSRVFQLFTLAMFAAVELQAQGVRFAATSANVSGAGESIKINLSEWSPDSRRDELVAAWTLTAAAPQGRGGRGGGGAGGRGGGAGRGGRGGAAAPAAADLPPDPDLVDPDNPAPARGRGGRGGGGGGGGTPQTPESSLAAALKRAPTVGILWTSENVGYSIKYAYRLPQADGGERIILATDRRVGMWSNLWKPGTAVAATDYPFSLIELRVDPKGDGDGRGVLSGKVAVDSTARTIALEGYAGLPVVLRGLKRLP